MNFVSGTDSNPRRVPVGGCIDPLIVIICSRLRSFPKIDLRMEDIRVIDGHHFLVANFDGQLLYDGVVQAQNHSPVGILAVKRGSEGQLCGPGDNPIVFAKVGEHDRQLLVLVDAARIVGDDHGLPQNFDTQGQAEKLIRVKPASEFA